MTPSTTSKELSERLKALGVKQDSYFGWYCNPWAFSDKTRFDVYTTENHRDGIERWAAAFTAGELWEKLPSRLHNPEGGEHSTHQLVCEKFPDGRANVSYVCIKCKGNLVKNQVSASLAEEMGEMLAYLLTNGLL